MGRRRADKLPEIKLHAPSGNARVFVNGKEVWLGRFGSPDAPARYEQIVAAYLASGRQSIEAVVSPAAAGVATRTVPAGITVGELVFRWIEHIEATKPNARRSSLYHGALAAGRALRAHAAMPAALFGTRALIEVQKLLVETKYVPRKHTAEGEPPPEPVRRSRRYVNDIVGRVRQLFAWAALQEFVPEERAKALELVPALRLGDSKARETKGRRPVRSSLVKATLPHLTNEVADLVRFIRLTGCRPSEACRMKLCQVHDRDLPVWRYVVRRHKTSRYGKARSIAIGPRAQAIVLAHTEGRDPKDYVFTPQRSLRRKPDGTPLNRRPSPRVGRMFTKDAIARAVRRACVAAELPSWTPYQLRYARLREIRRRGTREMAQAVAGHARATMTDHYAPPDWHRAVKAALRGG